MDWLTGCVFERLIRQLEVLVLRPVVSSAALLGFPWRSFTHCGERHFYRCVHKTRYNRPRPDPCGVTNNQRRKTQSNQPTPTPPPFAAITRQNVIRHYESVKRCPVGRSGLHRSATVGKRTGRRSLPAVGKTPQVAIGYADQSFSKSSRYFHRACTENPESASDYQQVLKTSI